ncbi:MAG: hypothetical protein IPH84_18280 [Bacteroidales bacterium]|nr:hypothetical protein [Bacteroidales bacterium]
MASLLMQMQYSLLMIMVICSALDISNGTCTASTDDSERYIFESPVVSNAGPAQNLCNVNTTLAGNDPTRYRPLDSCLRSLTPAITTPTAYNSTVTSWYQVVCIQWTISNGVCTPSESTVTITNYATPTTAVAGADQNLCGTFVSAGLGANTPANGTGAGQSYQVGYFLSGCCCKCNIHC